MENKYFDKINRNKWLRYLGVKQELPSELSAQLDECEHILLETSNPRSIYIVIEKKELKRDGFSIEKHLEGCDKVAIIAATLGAGVDALIRRSSYTDMAESVMLDTGASVLIEQISEGVLEEIKKNIDGYLTEGFSPGYGDYSIEYQSHVLDLVDAGRKIGLTLTQSNMMVPSKSITSISGIADHPVKGRLATCGECILRTKCTLREDGRRCYDWKN